MPTYCFRCTRCGGSFSRVLSVDGLSARKGKVNCELCDSRQTERDFVAEHGGFRNTPGNWPLRSDAVGVHPLQAQEAYAESVKLGVPTYFDPRDGAAVFSGPEHRKRYCEAHPMKFYDKNGGYSDPQRRS